MDKQLLMEKNSDDLFQNQINLLVSFQINLHRG